MCPITFCCLIGKPLLSNVFEMIELLSLQYSYKWLERHSESIGVQHGFRKLLFEVRSFVCGSEIFCDWLKRYAGTRHSCHWLAITISKTASNRFTKILPISHQLANL
jgi:hypothetical protein